MIDWAKVFEVFGSGVLGVYLVMLLLMVLTQLSTKVIDLVEKHWSKGAEPLPKQAVQKDAVPAGGNPNV